MKKVVSKEILQDKILESINLLCGTVKKTLGPIGNNVLIDHSTFSPFITNDGVTIAKNIESDDETIGAILEIIKEASIKTNNEVGDGTTTTLVLLESIYKESLEYIKNGISPVFLKKELNKTLDIILSDLEKLKRKATKKDLKNIAIIATGEEELGELAYQVVSKVKQKEAIAIKEILENKTKISYYKGYSFESTLASLYFLKDTNVLKCHGAYILLINTVLTNLECISFILNDILKNKRDLIIIANDFQENVVEELVSISLTEKLSICCLKIEEYGMHVYKIMKDIANITNGTIVDQENHITSNDVGIAENIEITKEKVKIDFKATNKTKNYLKKLKIAKKELTNDLEKDFFNKRIAMFSKGTAEINLGAPTKTEVLEKRMRLEDAICALSVCNNGIMLGGGISLLQIAENIKETNEASKIWKKALEEPFIQILKNAGIDYSDIKKKIKKEHYKQIYNVSNSTWEESSSTKVIDPYLVIKHTLINAASIASMLFTTTSLIINEYKNNYNKENEYNNW